MIKKVLAGLLGCTLIITGITAWNPNQVKAEDAYIKIYDEFDLDGIRSNPSANYELMNDIDLSQATSPGGELDSNGNGWNPINDFSGTLEGNGFRIIGLQMTGTPNYLTNGTRAGSSYAGFLGDTADGAVIRNVGFVDVDVKIHSTAGQLYFGIISSNGVDEASGCYVSGEINIEIPKGTTINAGALLGQNYWCSVKNCYNTANLSVSIYDYPDNTNEEEEYEDEEEMGQEEFDYSNNRRQYSIGGLMGFHHAGSCHNCYNIGKVTFNNMAWEPIVGLSQYPEWKYFDNSYYIKDIGENSTQGVSLTSAMMQREKSYKQFDFDNVWFIDKFSDYRYPQLRLNPQVRMNRFELVSEIDKTEYEYNDKLDLRGGEFEIGYEDATSYRGSLSEISTRDIILKNLGENNIAAQYGGMEFSFSVTVKKRNIAKSAKVTNISNKRYTGHKAIQRPIVKIGSLKLKQGVDYTVSYKNNVKVGKATVIIRGKGNYQGTIKKTFRIVTR